MKKIFLYAILLLSLNSVFAACITIPAVPNCIGSLYTVDNLNTSSGITYISTSSQTRNGLNMSNGAILIVCSGTLTLHGGNFNGGTIYVSHGATLSTDASSFNSTIINYGTLNFTSNVTVNSSGALQNASTGIINITGGLFENSILTNYGTVNMSGALTVQNGGSGACLGTGAKINASTINFGNNTNAIVSPSGKACIRTTTISGSGSTKITNSSDLILCGTSTLSTGGNGDISTATVNQNCASCDAALPIELLYFNGKNMKEFVFLDWATASEKNNDFFSVLRSYDGISFENLANITGSGTSTSTRYYTYKDYDAKTGINYYKLKQTDYDGKSDVSKTLSINRSDLEFNILVYPIPSTSPNVKLAVYKSIGRINVKCISTSGVIMFDVDLDTEEKSEYGLGQYNLPSGTYFIKIESETSIYVKQIVIKN